MTGNGFFYYMLVLDSPTIHVSDTDTSFLAPTMIIYRVYAPIIRHKHHWVSTSHTKINPRSKITPDVMSDQLNQPRLFVADLSGYQCDSIKTGVHITSRSVSAHTRNFTPPLMCIGLDWPMSTCRSAEGPYSVMREQSMSHKPCLSIIVRQAICVFLMYRW